MSPFHIWAYQVLAPVAVSVLALISASGSAQTPHALFLDDNETAMARMMADMHIAPTGDVDRDFVAMMIPHHQGAIDMAKSQLKYGHNPRLKRIAQEIIITQDQEIALMRQVLKTEAALAQPRLEVKRSGDLQ